MTDRLSADSARHELAEIRRHRDAMPGVAGGEEQAAAPGLNPAGPRQLVARERDVPAPGVLDGSVSQLREHRLQVPPQHLRRPSGCFGRRRAEFRAPAEQQPHVGSEPEVMKEMAGIERHAAVRQHLGRFGRTKRFGRDDVAADRHQAPAQRGRRVIGVPVGGHQHVARLNASAGRLDCPAASFVCTRAIAEAAAAALIFVEATSARYCCRRAS